MHLSFDGATLGGALGATFGRRSIAIPAATPLALTPAFTEVDGKRAQWAGFLRRNRLTTAPLDLNVVIKKIAEFVGPVLAAAGKNEGFAGTWSPGGPWHLKGNPDG
ncbi:MAG: hypothetical protein K8R59_00055 [Thermoanaerobaculales bacterium]|nr:hypothetical protein [Thermoanaerobaculales bacterium]